jgi:hypothetical protein
MVGMYGSGIAKKQKHEDCFLLNGHGRGEAIGVVGIAQPTKSTTSIFLTRFRARRLVSSLTLSLESESSVKRSMYSLPSGVCEIFEGLMGVLLVEPRSRFRFDLLSDLSLVAAIWACGGRARVSVIRGEGEGGAKEVRYAYSLTAEKLPGFFGGESFDGSFFQGKGGGGTRDDQELLEGNCCGHV